MSGILNLPGLRELDKKESDIDALRLPVKTPRMPVLLKKVKL